mmetsp:Transcript_51386/g.149238  ORF Transcript_51386/g.149238 Transcript_51386/m.149238 type:complete len:314 (-) Transcript_51386:94-1035(-)
MSAAPHCSGAVLRRLAALVASVSALRCAAVSLGTDPKHDKYGLRCLADSQDSLQSYVTAIVSTSPRAEDASGQGLEVLKETVGSIRNALGLSRANVVVAWDALPVTNISEGTQAVPEATAKFYGQKLHDFKEWNENELGGAVTIFENKEWTHQAEMLHRVFEHLEATRTLAPLVYLAQDDSPVSGNIDVPLILRSLSCDPEVDYVRFLWSNDCTEGRAANWNQPCEQHPRTHLLHSVGRMSDRPHFATTDFYFNQIFRRIPRAYRGAPERKAIGLKHAWIYGARHMMLHDSNVLQNSYNDQPKSPTSLALARA